jgi:integrase
VGRDNNLRRTILLGFFKWLYYPKEEPKNRNIPAVMENIPMLKRREQSIYKPTDLWTVEDDILFLRYCPNKRDKCYHAISRDTSCRPNEILRLKIKAEVLVNGKTGSRSTPLFNSIPYIKEWLDDHVQRGNPSAFLIPSACRKNFGKRLAADSINFVYRTYKTRY